MTFFLLRIGSRSAMKIERSSGDSLSPWGTPSCCTIHFDRKGPSFTCTMFGCRTARININMLFLIPIISILNKQRRCRPGFTQDGSMTLKLIGSKLEIMRKRNFESTVMSFYQQELRPKCKVESFYTTEKQKKIDCFHVDCYCDHCKTVFEAMGCYFHFCSCQETRPPLSEQYI